MRSAKSTGRTIGMLLLRKRSSSGVLHRVDSSPENPRHDSPYFRSAVAEGSCRNSEQFECGAVRRSGPGF